MRKKRVKISNFANLVDFLAWEKSEKGKPILVNSLDYNLLSNLKDLVEKIGFMLLSADILKESISHHRSLMKLPFEKRVKKFSNDKYYLYNFIIYTKASLDSIAVTLNSFFDLGFKRGQIDLGKWVFVRKIENSLSDFKNFSKTSQDWIARIIEYRDAVIHQKSIDIYPSGRRWTKMIPLHPLSDAELRELKDEYDTTSIKNKKHQISKSLNLVNLDMFMKTSITNILAITGVLSAEILRELKKKYPTHKPSKTYYY